jgi:hypothetical protein
MIARAVAERVGLQVCQAADEVDVIADRSSGFRIGVNSKPAPV